jgi:hypothetical protein
MLERKEWKYGSNITKRDYLAADTSFEHLVQEICDSISAVTADKVSFVVEPENGKYSGADPLLKKLRCQRPVWRVQLKSVLLDRFFNGRDGIRAQYYKSVYHGQKENLYLISRLSDRLIELARFKDSSVEMDLLRTSLSKPSAKVWISERDIQGQEIIRAGDLELDEESIQNDWLEIAKKVKSDGYDSGEYQFYCAALNGVRAPIPDQLEMKGAWIDESRVHEYVTSDKRDRDWQIFMFGFS